MTTSFNYSLLSSALITGIVLYGFYFDYKRRTSKEFRRNLVKERKKAQELLIQAQLLEQEQAKEMEFDSSFAASLPNEPIPTSNQDREKYFMQHLQLGEQLMLQG